MRLPLGALVIFALLLAACADNGGGTDATPTPGGDTSGNGTAMSCEEAFAQVDAEDATEAIEQSGEALDDTIEACDSVEEWLQAAGDTFGITEEEGLAHLEGRCRSNPELAHLNACPAARES